jgi:AcrR family transcriptional regulator
MASIDRRQAILDAALHSFSERGVAAATVEDVRRLSGASVGSIYHHFGDKEGLAAALYVEGLRDYQQGFLAVLSRERSAERGVKGLVRHHLRWVARHPDLASFLLAGPPPGAAEALEPLNRELFEATGTWMAEQVRLGRIRRLPRDLLYAVLVGPAQEFCRHWLQGGLPSSMTTAERVLARAAWDSLRLPKPQADRSRR